METGFQSYPLSAQLWRKDGLLVVENCDGVRICTIPIGSLVASGDFNWDYVIYCVQSCVEEEGELVDRNRQKCFEVSKTPYAGTVVYIKRDAPSIACTLTRGPFGKKRGRPAGDSGSATASTMSNSKRSTTNQNKFRLGLVARDGRCLISATPYDTCTAAHIVPFSRPDIYADILGYRDEWLFETWMGLLLDDRIHHQFDRYDISIFPRDHDWVIHVFYSRDHSLLQHHGKSFGSDRFNLPRPFWPMRELLLWHHRQCIQMHYRGFSVRMSADDEVRTQ